MELLLRAAHAEALDAAELALLDLLGIAVLVEEFRDGRADLRKRGLDALAHVRRTAHDLERFLAVRHLADVQVVGIGMRLAFQYFRNDDQIGKRRATDRLYALDLQPCAGQLFGEFLGVDVVDFNVVIQPTEWELHSVVLLSSLKLLYPALPGLRARQALPLRQARQALPLRQAQLAPLQRVLPRREPLRPLAAARLA